ncbi:unnamed protein product [Durusdinium trenchii]|uniref:25S rRNA (uridine-N(3))-methyltransferase BMT5-like domain-containing protein n=1 Tax=Durusdinium trenchii TaxID=1381693 RepID=A0ABP0HXS9_9DINO
MKRKADEPGGVSPGRLRAVFGLEREGTRVLLLGEGNLSFAWAISKLKLSCVIASTFETEDEHRERFQGSQARTQMLRDAGVQVIFGVDATDLSTLPEEVKEKPFERVIFQFPQHPERNKIHLNRQLLRQSLQEASRLLTEDGQVLISLLQGQGGSPAEATQRRPKDTWQAQEMGLEAGLLLVGVSECPMEELLAMGYESTGFRGRGLRDQTKEVYQERSFNVTGSLTHRFARLGPGVQSAFPTVRSHDISFWIQENFSEDLLLRTCAAVALGGELDVQPELKLLDEYCSPMDGRRARTYRRSVQTPTRADVL